MYQYVNEPAIGREFENESLLDSSFANEEGQDIFSCSILTVWEVTTAYWNLNTTATSDLAPRTHLTVDNMKELNLLWVSDRAKQLRLNNAHKIFYNQAPECLQENFVKTRNRLQPHTRNSQWNFNVPNVKGNE